MHISLGGLFIVGENGGASYSVWEIMEDFVQFLFSNISSYKTMIRDNNVVVDFRGQFLKNLRLFVDVSPLG